MVLPDSNSDEKFNEKDDFDFKQNTEKPSNINNQDKIEGEVVEDQISDLQKEKKNDPFLNEDLVSKDIFETDYLENSTFEQGESSEESETDEFLTINDAFENFLKEVLGEEEESEDPDETQKIIALFDEDQEALNQLNEEDEGASFNRSGLPDQWELIDQMITEKLEPILDQLKPNDFYRQYKWSDVFSQMYGNFGEDGPFLDDYRESDLENIEESERSFIDREVTEKELLMFLEKVLSTDAFLTWFYNQALPSGVTKKMYKIDRLLGIYFKDASLVVPGLLPLDLPQIFPIERLNSYRILKYQFIQLLMYLNSENILDVMFTTLPIKEDPQPDAENYEVGFVTIGIRKYCPGQALVPGTRSLTVDILNFVFTTQQYRDLYDRLNSGLIFNEPIYTKYYRELKILARFLVKLVGEAHGISVTLDYLFINYINYRLFINKKENALFLSFIREIYPNQQRFAEIVYLVLRKLYTVESGPNGPEEFFYVQTFFLGKTQIFSYSKVFSLAIPILRLDPDLSKD